jgi:hypothetical protein
MREDEDRERRRRDAHVVRQAVDRTQRPEYREAQALVNLCTPKNLSTLEP